MSTIEMDKALVLDEINEYLENNYIDKSRGQCYNETMNLYFHLVDFIYANIDEPEDFIDSYLEVVEGYYEIDYPQNLPLNFQDLKTKELNEFLDMYESEIDITDEEEVSQAIFEYIVSTGDKQRLSEFYLIPHAWLLFDGDIIDVTVEQFSKAVDPSIMKDIDRYNN